MSEIEREKGKQRERQLQADFEVDDDGEDAHHAFVFFAFVMSTQLLQF